MPRNTKQKNICSKTHLLIITNRVLQADRSREWKTDKAYKKEAIALLEMLMKMNLEVFRDNYGDKTCASNNLNDFFAVLNSFVFIKECPYRRKEVHEAKRNHFLQIFREAETDQSLSQGCQWIFTFFIRRMEELNKMLKKMLYQRISERKPIDNPHPHLMEKLARENKKIQVIQRKTVLLTTLMAAQRLGKEAVENNAVSHMGLVFKEGNPMVKAISSYIGNEGHFGFVCP